MRHLWKLHDSIAPSHECPDLEPLLLIECVVLLAYLVDVYMTCGLTLSIQHLLELRSLPIIICSTLLSLTDTG